MKLTRITKESNKAVVELNKDDLVMLLGAIRETLEALGTSELQTRTGFYRQEFVELQQQLRSIRTKMT